MGSNKRPSATPRQSLEPLGACSSAYKTSFAHRVVPCDLRHEMPRDQHCQPHWGCSCWSQVDCGAYYLRVGDGIAAGWSYNTRSAYGNVNHSSLCAP